jgi:putative acetyltransferase
MKSPDLPFTIRDYHGSDLETVADLWWGSWQSADVNAPVTRDELRDRLAAPTHGSTMHIARVGGSLAGFVTLSGDRLEQLFVAPEWQNRGIGKLLLDFAKSRKPEGFRLHAAAESRAVRFYEREGLTRGETGTHSRFGFAIVTFHWQP